MASDALMVVMKFMNDGGDLMWVVVALTPIALVRLLRLAQRQRQGEAVALAAWLAVPTALAGLGGLGGILRLEGLREAFRWGVVERQGAFAAIGISHTHNPPILALTVASGLCVWSAVSAGRAAVPRAPPDRRMRVATLALALTTAAFSWQHDLGYLALLASGALAPLGAWTLTTRAPSDEHGLRASVTSTLSGLLGVTAAWAASAFALDQRRLHARAALDEQEVWGALGQSVQTRPTVALSTLPPSLHELAAPALVGVLLTAVIAARVLIPFVRQSDPRARRDLLACAALVALAGGLLLGASWPGAFLEERLARLPVLPTP